MHLRPRKRCAGLVPTPSVMDGLAELYKDGTIGRGMLELLHTLCWKCKGGGVANVGALTLSLQMVALAEFVSQIHLVLYVQVVLLEFEQHSLRLLRCTVKMFMIISSGWL